MSASIRILDDQRVLEVYYSAEVLTDADLNEQRTRVAATLSRNGITKALFDASALPQLPPLVTMLEHNMAVASDNTLRRTRFAVVFRSVGDHERFLENTAVNRGIELRCFTSKADALTWLNR